MENEFDWSVSMSVPSNRVQNQYKFYSGTNVNVSKSKFMHKMSIIGTEVSSYRFVTYELQLSQSFCVRDSQLIQLRLKVAIYTDSDRKILGKQSDSLRQPQTVIFLKFFISQIIICYKRTGTSELSDYLFPYHDLHNIIHFNLHRETVTLFDNI